MDERLETWIAAERLIAEHRVVVSRLDLLIYDPAREADPRFAQLVEETLRQSGG